MEDDDDAPKLSASTLAALQSFMSDQRAEQAQDEEEGGFREAKDGEYEMLKENWGMSQFWYDAHTSKTVADELYFLTARSGLPIACIACPSLYTQLKKSYPEAQVCLFEYDQRFSRYGADFVFYDYNQPMDIPSKLHQHFHVVVADPPYLAVVALRGLMEMNEGITSEADFGMQSKECLEKIAETMKYLAKNPETSPLVLLTGSVQRDNALNLLKARPCQFRPVHTNKLGNEFLLFTNYDPQSRLGGWDQEGST